MTRESREGRGITEVEDTDVDEKVTTVRIPQDLDTRLRAFRPVVETVLEEPVSDEDYLALLLDRVPMNL